MTPNKVFNHQNLILYKLLDEKDLKKYGKLIFFDKQVGKEYIYFFVYEMYHKRSFFYINIEDGQFQIKALVPHNDERIQDKSIEKANKIRKLMKQRMKKQPYFAFSSNLKEVYFSLILSG